MLRPNEREAKQLLESHFQYNEVVIKFIEGSDPPDLLAIFNGSQISVEITQAVDKSIRNNSLENRVTQDSAIADICDFINAKLGNKIPSDKTLLLFIAGPAPDTTKFRKSLHALIQKIVEDEAFLNKLYATPMKKNIETVPVDLKLIDTQPESKRISCWIQNRNSIPDINRHVFLVLRDRIRDKEIKMSSMHGEKWLVIINRLVLASIDNFIEAFSKLKIMHSFSKIFIIDDGKIFELFSAPPECY